MNWEKVTEEVKTQSWIILGILGVSGFFFMSPTFTLGIILGGLLIIINFNALQKSIQRSFSYGDISGNSKKIIISKYYFRLAIIAIIIYILITSGWVDPIGLVLGLSTVPISILGVGIRAVLKISL